MLTLPLAGAGEVSVLPRTLITSFNNMKKTIITALLALGFTASAFATDYTFSYTNKVDDQNKITMGWVDTLQNAATKAGVTSGLTDSLSLTSVTVYVWGSTADPTFKLAIYEKGSTVSSTGSFVALSTNSVNVTKGAGYTFTFSDVVLDKDTFYRFVFVDDDTTTETLDVSGEDAAVKAALKDAAVSVKYDYVASNAPEGGGLLTESDPYAWSKGTDTPKLDYKVSTVPEPATATLSLLALAGLAARRRRK